MLCAVETMASGGVGMRVRVRNAEMSKMELCSAMIPSDVDSRMISLQLPITALRSPSRTALLQCYPSIPGHGCQISVSRRGLEHSGGCPRIPKLDAQVDRLDEDQFKIHVNRNV